MIFFSVLGEEQATHEPKGFSNLRNRVYNNDSQAGVKPRVWHVGESINI